MQFQRERETAEELDRQRRIFEFCGLETDGFSNTFVKHVVFHICEDRIDELKIDCRDMYRKYYRLKNAVLYRLKIMEWLVLTYLTYRDRNPEDRLKVLNSLNRDICIEMNKADRQGLIDEAELLHDIFIIITGFVKRYNQPEEKEKPEFIIKQINNYELDSKELDRILSFID